MANAVGVQVFTAFPGLEAIEKTAKKRAITLKAVKAGAKLVQQSAKARAPRRAKSGALKQSMGIKSQKGTRGKTLAFAVVGARKKVVKQYKGRKIVPANYAHLVEKGTRPHSLLKRVKGKLKKAIRFARIKAGKGAKHPGAKAKPFLKPAFDSQKNAVGTVMLRVLGEEIAKAVVSAAAKAAKG